MARLPDWDERLFAVVEAHDGIAFAWGRADCCTFAAACVEAVTGTRPYPDEVGRYRGLAGSRRRLRARGFTSIADGVAALFPEIAPVMAGRGDLGIVQRGASETIVVGVGPRFITLAPSGGFEAVRHDQLSRAYRVG